MTNSYTLIPNTQVLRSKIDVFEMTDPYDEDIKHRLELTIDNDGVFITSCEKKMSGKTSVSVIRTWQLLLLFVFWKHTDKSNES
jgi:hypothetical protein